MQLLAQANKAQKTINSLWFNLQKEAVKLAVQEGDLRAMSRLVRSVHAHKSLRSAELVQFFLYCAGAADGGKDCAINYDVKNMTFTIKVELDENGVATKVKRSLPTDMMAKAMRAPWFKWAKPSKPNPYRIATLFAAVKAGLKEMELPESALSTEERQLLNTIAQECGKAGFAEKIQ